MDGLLRLSGWNGFGCNGKHEIWPRDKRGYVREERRTYVQDQHRLLEKIVGILLEEFPRGRDFMVQQAAAFLLNGGELFVLLRPLGANSRYSRLMYGPW